MESPPAYSQSAQVLCVEGKQNFNLSKSVTLLYSFRFETTLDLSQMFTVFRCPCPFPS